jgi:hypothetical protein
MITKYRIARAYSTPVRLIVALLAVAIFGCGGQGSNELQAGAQQSFSDPDVVAKVGETPISLEMLGKATSASGGVPRLVLEHLIEARVLGHFAELGGLQLGRYQTVRRAVLSRAVLERLEATAKQPETPTNGEVESLTAERWTEFDRGEAFKTCHAVIHADALVPELGEKAAKRLAESLRPYSSCRDFLAHAKTLKFPDVKLTAEELPAVLADGRTVTVNRHDEPGEEGPRFDEVFARAVHQLKVSGEQSGVVRTRFGWHVVLLAARIPEKRLPFSQRREALTVDIYRRRAHEASEAVLAQCRKSVPISVDRSAIEAMSRARVTP